MAQPMRECPVCEAIVLLHQDHCTICGHDLSLPAPVAGEEPPPPEPEPAPAPAPEASVESSNDTARLPTEDSPREGVSVFVGVVGFIAAALLILWFVRLDGPLDDEETEGDPVTAADEPIEEVDLARSVCSGEVAGIDGAAAYADTPGVHSTAVVIGDLTGSDVATSTDLFPAEWLVDVAAQPLARSELILCMNRLSVGEVTSECAAGDDPEALVRVEASYRVVLVETATGTALADETVGPAPFGPCPADVGDGPDTVYADPDPVALVNLVVPIIFIN